MSPRTIGELPHPDAATIQAVQASCADLLDRPEVLAESFYTHLFEAVPHIRELFPEDMSRQTTRMAQAIIQVVNHLDRPAQMQNYLMRLGRYHHEKWGLGPEDYPCVGRAMVEAVHDLSPTWSSSFSSAWILVYEWIAASMLAGATASVAPPEPKPAGRCPVGARGTAPGRTAG
ncbi:globin domain-containing protein [Nocardiopsis ansamitocini]|uniref:Hemoglobin n=1 Tax=Nocardiopsis ansamitocini TaxID=1670832 RepID=A0A9W6P3J2_9ACTN|nr:globin domain-containing protein [Nocardiopsis ansamitocini]GLU46511.1 hemoglobin [Nocardiopsis ansamitocini]